MVMEYGKIQRETTILVSGYKIWLMDMEFTNGKMATDMKVSGDTH